MKHIASFTVAVTAFAIFMLAATPNAQASGICSKATLSGSYAATITGTIAGQPFAELDLVTSDGRGSFTGSGTVSENGVISPASFTATYTVNADCSGSATLSTGVTQNLVIHADGSEVQFIGTNAGTVVTGDAKRVIP